MQLKKAAAYTATYKKVIQFLLAGNIAEITTLFIATLFNWNAPLLAVHILWVNLATATLPALALGVDPASKNIMKHKPVKSGTLFEKRLADSRGCTRYFCGYPYINGLPYRQQHIKPRRRSNHGVLRTCVFRSYCVL